MRVFAVCIIIGLTYASAAKGQKLPTVQTAGLRAPANIKVDGKTAEWGLLKAYNKTTQVYYSLANDDEHLYLAVKAPSREQVEKIIKGGITLSINPRAKQKGNIPAITFPVYDKADYYFAWNIGDKPATTGDVVKDKIRLDSFTREKTKQVSGRMKWIGTFNVKGISDSLTSVYNQDGIKAAWALDADLCYNYELAVPLKYIGMAPTAKHFYYQLQLNGFSFYIVRAWEARPGIILMTGIDGRNFRDGSSVGTDQTYPTNFWGEYILVK